MTQSLTGVKRRAYISVAKKSRGTAGRPEKTKNASKQVVTVYCKLGRNWLIVSFRTELYGFCNAFLILNQIVLLRRGIFFTVGLTLKWGPL